MITFPMRFYNLIKLALMLALLVSLWWLVQPALAANMIDDNNFSNPQLLSPHAQCSVTITVTSNGDSGAGTLRQALIDICDGGTIDFDAGLANNTITLTSDQLTISRTMTIANPYASNLSISGNNTYTVFYIDNGSVVTMNNLNIINGYSSFYGGGIHNNDGTLIIQNSTVSNNSAYVGGGIYDGLNNSLTIENCTISGNTADYGGGIVSDGGAGDSSTTIIKNSTFSNNISNDIGGGIYNIDQLHLYNNIFANSTGVDCLNNGTIVTNINNLIEDGTCNEGTTLSGFQSGDPNLDSLQDNGGSTLTHALLSGSPAIDTGDNINCLATDQRGVSRPQDGNGDSSTICDIGAFEFKLQQAPNTPSNPTPANGSTNIPINRGLSWQGGDPDGDVVTYTIAFGTNNPPPIVGTTTYTRYIPSLLTSTIYYWIITATDGISESAGGLWSFTTSSNDLSFVYLPIVLK